MKTPFSSNSLSDAMRRRVDMAVAVAHERLLATHVRHALDFVDLVDDRVPFDDVLDIYARLMRMSSEEAGIVSTRALATLGQRADSGEEHRPRPTGDSESEMELSENGQARSESFLSRIRQRIRGRIDEELRFLIELEAARAEEALLYTHVENALHFVDLLEEELRVPEAVDLYLDALDVREAYSEIVYNLTLAQLSDAYLPDGGSERKTEPEIVLREGAAITDDATASHSRRRAG